MASRIEFVNHSSFILTSGSMKMIVDPWLEGTVFDNGWGLLSETVLDDETLREITHIWFSHEHPDHFSPPSLRRIPVDCRAGITIVFQETKDKKVVDYCREQGFGVVIELPDGEPSELADGVSITCWRYQGFADSYSLIVTPDARILNLNDCTVNTESEAREVRDRVGSVDVLFTQFSISAWDGNVEEVQRRTAGARTMLERTVMQCRVLEPKWVIPCASFIWFCHEENGYMNSAFLPIEEVYDLVEQGTAGACLLLYPGDRWQIGCVHDSRHAIDRYARDQASLPERERIKADSIAVEELVAAATRFCEKLLKGSSRSKTRLHLVRQNRRWAHDRRVEFGLSDRLGTLAMQVDPARVYVRDHEQAYLFDLFGGLRTSDLQEAECDVAIGSAALHYAFNFLWGGNTLHINGRFHRIAPAGRGPLFHYFTLAGNRNAGATIRWRGLLPFSRGAADRVESR